jgi:hypothetical protein
MVASALYAPEPCAEEADFFGISPEQASGPPIEVWPDNAQSVATFMALSTQWRMGARSPVGLDYAAIPAVLRLRGIPRAEHAQLFADIQVMESAALATMRQAQAKE